MKLICIHYVLVFIDDKFVIYWDLVLEKTEFWKEVKNNWKPSSTKVDILANIVDDPGWRLKILICCSEEQNFTWWDVNVSCTPRVNAPIKFSITRSMALKKWVMSCEAVID